MTAPLTPELAELWRRADPPRLRRRLPAVLAWVALIVTSIAVSWDVPCSVDYPCQTRWGEMADFSLAFMSPLLLLALPVLGVVVSLAGAAAYGVVEGQGNQIPHGLAVALALLVAAATLELALRMDRGRRAAALLRRQAGPPRSWPESVSLPGGPPGGVVVAAVLTVTGALLLSHGVRSDRDQRVLEELAQHRVGTVVAHNDDDFTVTVAYDDTRAIVDVSDPAYYPVGSEQELLVSPEFTRLAVDAYDAGGWLFGAVAAWLAGLAFAVGSLRRRHQLRQLFTGQVVTHSVTALVGPHTVVATEQCPDEPLLELPLVPALSGAARRAQQPAVLLGDPRAGAFCGLQLSDGTVLLPVGRARRDVTTEPVDGLDGWGVPDEALEPEEAASVLDEVDEERRVLAPGWGTWRRWQVLGVALLVAGVVGAGVVAWTTRTPGELVFRLALTAIMSARGARLVGTSVSLLPQVLEQKTANRVVRIPFRRIVAVEADLGAVVLLLSDGRRLPLGLLLPQGYWRTRTLRTAARDTARLLQAHVLSARVGGTQDIDTEVQESPRALGRLVAVGYVAAVVVGRLFGGAS